MMNKIQVGSGHSSSATHRLTQASTTLNRRYVRRPANIAIEEAARAANTSRSCEASPIHHSRLVNLNVRAADLEMAREQQSVTETPLATTENPVQPIAMYPNVVEFGSLEPTTSQESLSPTITSNMAMPNANQPNYSEKQSAVEALNDITPELPQINTAPQPEIDTNELAMSIAADYATASLGASMKEYGNNYNSYAMSDPNSTPAPIPTDSQITAPDSVDAIAQAASEAIATIRTATEPSEISEQVASLKAFADNIKSNHNTPEMRELSDTIDKFVNIAMKSGKIQPEVIKKTTAKSVAKPAKVTLSSKANRAATKITKTSAKVIAANRTKATASASPMSRQSPIKSSPRRNTMAIRPAKRLSSDELKERAIEQALESVATMNETPASKKRRQPAMRAKRKGGVKRFVIAFTCAAICVGGVIAFVGSNIPDISVRVAAMQTGITAAYPSYVPRDYKLGDIFSESGKITMIFEGPDDASFTLEEEKSSWDSSALLRNFVEANWGENYATTHEQGITIYIAEPTSDAVWVNGGVLYKITSSGTPLTKKQVRSIVTSL